MTTPGLEGVVAAQTRLSDVDGKGGRLIIGGYRVEQLVQLAGFERALGLLWDGSLPDPARTEQLRARLAQGRAAAFERLPALGDALDREDGMEALRAATAHVSDGTGEELVAAISVFAAAWARRRAGSPPVGPHPEHTHAQDYLAMVQGGAVDLAHSRALDAYWVAVCDHGMNASTFTARVVASTGSDDVSAVVAAIGALKGPLHGGAPGPVLDMLDRIGSPERAEAWLRTELDAGRRIMGMGHRIYRTRDPRVAVLERAVLDSGLSMRRAAVARAVEDAAERLLAERHPDRPMSANVELYTAVLLEAVGLPRALFSPTFAASRVAGWLAHAREQRATGRIVRPASEYVGPAPSE